MGQNASSDGDAFSLASAASSESLVSAGSEKKMSPEAALREVQRVKMRIQAFRVRSGTEDICSNLYSSWKAEKSRIISTWKELSLPARRAMIMDIREKVVHRARILHSVVARGASGSRNKTRVVRKLMEKCAFELFDTSVVYGDDSLPRLVEDILRSHGGGEDVPFGLLLDVNATFCVSPKKQSTDERSPVSDSDSEDQSVKTPTKQLSPGRSPNSLQGYYSTNESHLSRRHRSSHTIQNLLSFVPSSDMTLANRRKLTLELLMLMRHSFLVHFSVLVFSELFDAKQALYRYEYDSNSETDVGFSDTDLEEQSEDDDSEGSSHT
mmetsp:Transcript_9379/g.15303  ORF Transcript_9379/g.15303 Transcript_9379/m.15303 type:complete len:324 (-) Transcript_9379:144-1115(-)